MSSFPFLREFAMSGFNAVAPSGVGAKRPGIALSVVAIFAAVGLAWRVSMPLVAPAAAQSLEQIPPTEPTDISAVREKALAELKKNYPEGTPGIVRRDAHAKAHGCAKGVFQVDPNIPPEFRVGTFATPGRSFKAWVRYSNGAFYPGPDAGMDGRGMALKILDADPEVRATDSAVLAHDILMINHPVFFSSTAADYRDFSNAGALTGDTNGLRSYFAPSLVNPLSWRARQAYIAYRIASRTIRSPLDAQYYSMAPFQFGEGRAIKYLARPCGHVSVNKSGTTQDPNFLRDALRASLANGPACFDLLVQERVGSMPIEDTSIEWSEETSAYRKVGQLTLTKQLIDTHPRNEFCEQIRFDPWSAPAANRPLGGMNRLRRAVYDEISAYRTNRNKVTPPNANLAWDRL